MGRVFSALACAGAEDVFICWPLCREQSYRYLALMEQEQEASWG